MNKIKLNDAAVIGIALACLIMFIIGLAVIGIVIVWLFVFGGIKVIGETCLLFALPLLVVVVTAILAKKYLFKKGGK
jgi:hypothetical protein